ncbi:hypothetical protein [Marinilabilia salmonicolor]|uniref:hypothetical protein n=1 Tax=Marinilabilia salmonicolor TaxID=989 RepID=UPI001F221C1A|nr:hypothetical protein [Marinilabilia salmonicolor]
MEHLTGKDKIGRQWVIQEAIQGVLSILDTKGYKYIAPKDGSKLVSWGVNIETGFTLEPQLYHLKEDPQEIKNIAETHPDIVNNLKTRLDSIKR